MLRARKTLGPSGDLRASLAPYAFNFESLYVIPEINIKDGLSRHLALLYSYLPKSHPHSTPTVIVGCSVSRLLDRLPFQRDSSNTGR